MPGREPLPRLSPPPGFDPSLSRLYFQWTHGSAFDNELSITTNIYAGRYYLGTIQLGDPERLICARSPDGGKIAYSEWLENPPFSSAPLQWVDLGDLRRVYQPLAEVQPKVLAFSPDSSRLAFVGSEDQNQRGLYVLDLASNKAHRLRDVLPVEYLAWSPDGRSLALTGGHTPNTNLELLVIDAESGEITSRGMVQWGEAGQLFVPQGSPVAAWGIEKFQPSTTSAVEACAIPPD